MPTTRASCPAFGLLALRVMPRLFKSTLHPPEDGPTTGPLLSVKFRSNIWEIQNDLRLHAERGPPKIRGRKRPEFRNCFLEGAAGGSHRGAPIPQGSHKKKEFRNCRVQNWKKTSRILRTSGKHDQKIDLRRAPELSFCAPPTCRGHPLLVSSPCLIICKNLEKVRLC